MSSMWKIDPARTALLVIDMQNDFVLEGYPMEVPMARQRVPAMREMIQACRRAAIPVIYTQHILLDAFPISPLEATYNPRLLQAGMRRGSFGAEVVEALKPRTEDIVIEKHRYDAFHNTPLQTILATLRGLNAIDTLIISGTLTEVCCESTARSAYMRDYKVVFASDATGALSEQAQRTTEHNIRHFFGRTLSVAQIIAELHGEDVMEAADEH